MFSRGDVGMIYSRHATLYVRGIKQNPINTHGIEHAESKIICSIGGDKPSHVSTEPVTIRRYNIAILCSVNHHIVSQFSNWMTGR